MSLITKLFLFAGFGIVSAMLGLWHSRDRGNDFIAKTAKMFPLKVMRTWSPQLSSPARGLSALVASSMHDEFPKFEARLRNPDETGTRQSVMLREVDRIPGLVYGVGQDGRRERLLVTCARKELMREMRKHMSSVENIIYRLDLGEGRKSELVTMRQIQLRAASDYVISVNFLRFTTGRIIQFPLTYVNSEQNIFLKRGAYLKRIVNYVKCTVDTYDVPRALAVSIADGGKDHVFRLLDVVVPDGLTLKAKNLEQPIAVIKVPRGG